MLGRRRRQSFALGRSWRDVGQVLGRLRQLSLYGRLWRTPARIRPLFGGGGRVRIGFSQCWASLANSGRNSPTFGRHRKLVARMRPILGEVGQVWLESDQFWGQPAISRSSSPTLRRGGEILLDAHVRIPLPRHTCSMKWRQDLRREDERFRMSMSSTLRHRLEIPDGSFGDKEAKEYRNETRPGAQGRQDPFVSKSARKENALRKVMSHGCPFSGEKGPHATHQEHGNRRTRRGDHQHMSSPRRAHGIGCVGQ